MDPLKIKIGKVDLSIPIPVIVWTLIIVGVLILWITDTVPIGTAYFWLKAQFKDVFG